MSQKNLLISVQHVDYQGRFQLKTLSALCLKNFNFLFWLVATIIFTAVKTSTTPLLSTGNILILVYMEDLCCSFSILREEGKGPGREILVLNFYLGVGWCLESMNWSCVFPLKYLFCVSVLISFWGKLEQAFSSSHVPSLEHVAAACASQQGPSPARARTAHWTQKWPNKSHQ